MFVEPSIRQADALPHHRRTHDGALHAGVHADVRGGASLLRVQSMRGEPRSERWHLQQSHQTRRPQQTSAGMLAEKYHDVVAWTMPLQITVSNFHQWNNIAGHVGQILLAFFMGAWADRRGRKLPLLLGLLGKLYYSSMVIVNATQKSWPVEYIVYTATLPMAFTGADVAIFAAAFTYVTDISSSENRTLRVTILEVCYLASMPIGIAIGT